MTLRRLGQVWVLVALISGVLFAWIWLQSSRAWEQHLTRSYVTGFALFEALRAGAPFPLGVTSDVLSPDAQILAADNLFERLPEAPHPAYVTNLSIHTATDDPIRGETLSLAILSDRLRYQVAAISSRPEAGSAEKLGNVTRALAMFCSDPVLYARYGTGAWQQINGRAIWGCGARPADLRLPAGLGLFLVAAVLLGHVGVVAFSFEQFARRLRAHRYLSGAGSYDSSGPTELQDLAKALNRYLEIEQEQLSKRADVLSGISHDLGTPATRLRLRARLIEDTELRHKLDSDIDQMTNMIESVLTYTRAELNLEEPRKLSLLSLVEALVADYQDLERPVQLRPTPPLMVAGQGSLFMSRRVEARLPEDRRVIITARPVGLQRALSNLIDNALKYGRMACVSLEADARSVTILIEDAGSEMGPDDMQQVMEPFTRGSNVSDKQGSGLGLSIVSTILAIHGGSLQFETGTEGLRARVTLPR
ncbi:sensor histidine kinase [Epibacterium ulvae]|uniref:sensor histidine kinase n=1 Tax=Epibacterium ulvae TaxID=1156985 RepID=UPI0024900F13|nr:HAMP domain-containing sensor histidine kinase [Epibacterium ulvae]